MSYLQAIVIGLLQGITELFPVSRQSADESFYLAFLVGLHLATAVALLVHYRRDWIALTRGFAHSLRRRRVEGPTERLAWLLIVATIPVGIVGLAFEHALRTLFAKPLAAAAAPTRAGRRIEDLSLRDGVSIGAAEILALFAGISRSGVTMVAGLLRGLDHEHAARFSFMLATPVILAAGLYKLHDLLGPNGDGLHGQIIVGSIVAGLAAYAAVRFLERFFRTNTLVPFAVYCLGVGGLSIIRFA